MKKQTFLETATIVEEKDYKSILTATDPVNANRLEIGIYTALKGIFLAPAVNATATPWQAAGLVDAKGEAKHVSPRQLSAVVFLDGKAKKAHEEMVFPAGKSLIDLLNEETQFELKGYIPVKQDTFEKGADGKPLQKTKDFPVWKIHNVAAAPANKPANKKK